MASQDIEEACQCQGEDANLSSTYLIILALSPATPARDCINCKGMSIIQLRGDLISDTL